MTRLAAQVSGMLADGGGLGDLETAIRAGLSQLGAGLAESLLGADGGHRGPRVDCAAGHAAQFVGYRDKPVDTVLGTVRLRRAWYHCEECGHGLAPRDRELGVAGQTMSPGLRNITARVGAALPFAPAADLTADLTGVTLTAPRLRRRAETDGATAADIVTAEAAAIGSREVIPLPPDPLPDKLYIAVDGTGVPMVGAETRGRPGKAPDGRARTREAKLACLFTQTTTDPDGHPVRDPDTTTYLSSFAPAEEFGHLVAAEATRRGADHIRQLVVLGDGAHWIWNQAGARLPAATQIVDLYHAREHLHDLAATATPVTADPAAWLTDRLTELDNGDIEALTAAARALPLTGKPADQRDTAVGYFETNAHRMRYAHFRAQGMFVGSGTVEAGCKTIVAQRLKLSGMRWTTPGATAIITLRTQHASGRWEHIWHHPHHTGAA